MVYLYNRPFSRSRCSLTSQTRGLLCVADYVPMDFAHSTRYIFFPNRVLGIFPYHVTGPIWNPVIHVSRFSKYFGNAMFLLTMIILFYINHLSMSNLANLVDYFCFVNFTFTLFNIILTTRKNSKQLQSIHLFFCEFSSHRMFSVCQRSVALFSQLNLAIFIIFYLGQAYIYTYILNWSFIFSYLYFHIGFIYYYFFMIIIFTYLFTLNYLFVVLNQNTHAISQEIIQMHVQLRTHQRNINDNFGWFLLNLLLNILIRGVSNCFSIFNYEYLKLNDYFQLANSIINLILMIFYLAYFTSSIINEVSDTQNKLIINK